jgi:DNA-binding NarL/FixJ family response regulator
VGEATETAALSVVVIDDSEVVRAKLRGLLQAEQGFELVGEAPDGESGLEVAGDRQPDLVVMDLKMPGMSGIEATWRLGTVAPASRVLVLTVSAEQEDVTDAIIAGARGYVVKGAQDEEITAALRGVATGERVISPQVASKLVERVGEDYSHRKPVPHAAESPAAEPPARGSFIPVVAIALLAGLVVSAIGQGGEIVDGDAGAGTWLKCGLDLVVVLGAVILVLLAVRRD